MRISSSMHWDIVGDSADWSCVRYAAGSPIRPSHDVVRQCASVASVADDAEHHCCRKSNGNEKRQCQDQFLKHALAPRCSMQTRPIIGRTGKERHVDLRLAP